MKNIYRTRDGRDFDYEHEAKSHERQLDGLVHSCPVCHGSGKKYISFLVHEANPDVFLDRDQYEDRVYPCELCRGRAWRKTPWIPVYRQVVDHYTHADDEQTAKKDPDHA